MTPEERSQLIDQLDRSFGAHVLIGDNMNYIAIGMPIEFETLGYKNDHQWDDRRYGFCIVYDEDADPSERYQASWGEGPEDAFATLEEAKKWCQDTINAWARTNFLVAPNASGKGPEL